MAAESKQAVDEFLSGGEEVRVYRPGERHELGMFRIWAILIRNVVESRSLIWMLFKRDFLAQYKKSFIGYAWIPISPVIGIVAWVFMELTGVIKAGDLGIPYPAYVLAGTAMWGVFMGFYGAAAKTLQSGTGLITQVYYPHHVLLFKSALRELVSFATTLAVMLIFLTFFGVKPNWGVLALPLVLFPIFFLAASLGLVVSMMAVVAFDANKIVSMGMGFLMFTTPIIYGSDVPSPILQVIIKWNPMTYLVCSARDIVLFGHIYQNALKPFLLSAGGSFVLFMLSWRLFYLAEGRLVERMI